MSPLPWGRVAAVAGAVCAVFWLAFDSGLSSAGAPSGISPALLALAGVFGCGAWVMQKGGQPDRVPLLVGLCLGAGGYALLRLLV
jgi:hypothetical protein